MVTRRLLPFAALPLLALPSRAGQATPVVVPRSSGRNCGDPGGSFIACEALRDTLAITGVERCPVCGGRHRVPATP